MKKLLLIPEISGGGIGTYYYEQIKIGRFTDSEWDIICLVNDGEVLPDLPSNFKVISVNNLQKCTRFTNWIMFPTVKNCLDLAFSVYDLIDKSSYDLIETTDYQWLFVPWVMNGDSKTIRVTLHGSNGQVEFYENRSNQEYQVLMMLSLETALLNLCNDCIALSQFNAEWWNANGLRQVRVVPPFFKDLSEFKNLEPLYDKIVIAGRVQIWKGVETIAELMEKYSDLPPIEWVGGDNYYKDYSVSMVSHIRKNHPKIFGQSLIFRGRLPKAETKEIIQSASMVIIPSLWDTFNLVGLEAMLMGKIVIVSDQAGVSEYILNGINGFTFPAANVDILYSIVDRIRNMSVDERMKIGKNARESIEKVVTNFQIINDLNDQTFLKKNMVKSKFVFNEIFFGSRNSDFASSVLKTVPIKQLFSEIFTRIKK